MGKFKNALSMTGQLLTAIASREEEINEMTSKIMSKTTGVEYAVARQIAATLVDHAEVTWN